jgi:hypothetical protein
MNAYLSYSNEDQFMQIGRDINGNPGYGMYIGSYWEYLNESTRFIDPQSHITVEKETSWGISASLSLSASASLEIDAAPFGLGAKTTFGLEATVTVSGDYGKSWSVSLTIDGPAKAMGFQLINVLALPTNIEVPSNIKPLKVNNFNIVGLRAQASKYHVVTADFYSLGNLHDVAVELLKYNKVSNFNPPKITFPANITITAYNGKYLTIHKGDYYYVTNTATTPDSHCIFQCNMLENNYITLFADVGQYLSRFSIKHEGDYILASKLQVDNYCKFRLVYTAPNKYKLYADNNHILGIYNGDTLCPLGSENETCLFQLNF